MKKFGILIFLIFACSSIINASFQNEALHYVITYKWGLIHKDAGDATLSLKNTGTNYNIMLTAKTKPWADKFYQVRDTLKGIIRISDFKALEYQKIAHEKNKYGKDVINYKYNGSNVTGICQRFKRNEKGVISQSSKELTANGPTFDMLSVFYYLRQLNYANLRPGQKITASIFSGSKMETITIRNLGIETIKMRSGAKREAYHIKFNFTTSGKKKSSDDMDSWISTDSSHIPLYLVGKLPIGEVRVYYIS